MRCKVQDRDDELGTVLASENENPVSRREENILHAAERVRSVLNTMSKLPAYAAWDPQPRLLHAIRLIVECQNGGRRDSELEREVFSHWVAFNGLGQLTALLGIPELTYPKQA